MRGLQRRLELKATYGLHSMRSKRKWSCSNVEFYRRCFLDLFGFFFFFFFFFKFFFWVEPKGGVHLIG